ncbi:MAG: hypothetical protein MSJ26_10455 [Oscillospiraceae bacterium]|nr:hypothetical protein [Oscillospiraceae bacterium]
MPASKVILTEARNETIANNIDKAWSISYVYSYDSEMNRIRINSTKQQGVVVINLGKDYAGRNFTIYKGRNSTKKKVLSGTLDKNGKYTLKIGNGLNYTLVIE